jgi:hypothetical protein
VAQSCSRASSDFPSADYFDRSEYLESLVHLVCHGKLPFNIVTWPKFRRYSLSLNPTLERSLIKSRSTLVAHITKVYAFYRDQLRMKLRNSKSLIHFSVDLWSSPNRISFLGMHVKWVDEDYTLQKPCHPHLAWVSRLRGVFRWLA